MKMPKQVEPRARRRELEELLGNLHELAQRYQEAVDVLPSIEHELQILEQEIFVAALSIDGVRAALLPAPIANEGRIERYTALRLYSRSQGINRRPPGCVMSAHELAESGLADFPRIVGPFGDAVLRECDAALSPQLPPAA